MTTIRQKKLRPTRKSWKLWEEHLQKLARERIGSVAPSIDHANPKSSFDLMVTLISMGDADDQFLLDQFRHAELNVEDPFHWWHFVSDLLQVFKRGAPGRPRSWTVEEQERLKNQCIEAAMTPSPTKSIAEICRRMAKRGVRTETAEHLKFQVTRFGLTKDVKAAIAKRLK